MCRCWLTKYTTFKWVEDLSDLVSFCDENKDTKWISLGNVNNSQTKTAPGHTMSFARLWGELSNRSPQYSYVFTLGIWKKNENNKKSEGDSNEKTYSMCKNLIIVIIKITFFCFFLFNEPFTVDSNHLKKSRTL